MRKVFNTWDQQYVLRRLKAYRVGVLDRILRCFDGLEEEAERITEDIWEEMMSRPGDGSEDPSALAERAFDEGVEHYIMMDWLRQQTLNNATAGLYHLWEKDLKSFLQRTIVRYRGVDASKVEKADFPRLVSVLDDYGFKFEQQPYYGRMNELLHVANAAKHGTGPSLKKLIALRPDLFRHNSLTGEIDSDIENIEIREEQFNEFADVAAEFWDTFDIVL